MRRMVWTGLGGEDREWGEHTPDVVAVLHRGTDLGLV